jgi:hypothetical protein
MDHGERISMLLNKRTQQHLGIVNRTVVPQHQANLAARKLLGQKAFEERRQPSTGVVRDDGDVKKFQNQIQSNGCTRIGSMDFLSIVTEPAVNEPMRRCHCGPWTQRLSTDSRVGLHHFQRQAVPIFF